MKTIMLILLLLLVARGVGPVFVERGVRRACCGKSGKSGIRRRLLLVHGPAVRIA